MLWGQTRGRPTELTTVKKHIKMLIHPLLHLQFQFLANVTVRCFHYDCADSITEIYILTSQATEHEARQIVYSRYYNS